MMAPAHTSSMIAPVAALICWSMVMWLWMYATRIPAIRAAGMKLDPNAPRGAQAALLPPRVRWKADNYTHLMEQPTLFYALALSLAILGMSNGVASVLAWAYIGLRVLHSLIQAMSNTIEVRFLVFVLSNVPLLGMTGLLLRELLLQTSL